MVQMLISAEPSTETIQAFNIFLLRTSMGLRILLLLVFWHILYMTCPRSDFSVTGRTEETETKTWKQRIVLLVLFSFYNPITVISGGKRDYLYLENTGVTAGQHGHLATSLVLFLGWGDHATFVSDIKGWHRLNRQARILVIVACSQLHYLPQIKPNFNYQ